MVSITSDTRNKHYGASNLATLSTTQRLLLLSRTPCPALANVIEVISRRWSIPKECSMNHKGLGRWTHMERSNRLT